VSPVAYPAPRFDHLLRLSDDVGTLEHAHGSVPLRAHGYCVDDAARALVVVCREPSPGPELVELAGTLLAFLVHAGRPDGTFHNRLSYERRWTDTPEVGDWWGRALMAFGIAVARAPRHWMRDGALVAFERGAHQRSASPRAMAFAGIGAAELLAAVPDHQGARQLLIDAATTVGPPLASPEWPWPQPRLAYANAVLAEVHLAAGAALHDQRATAIGERLLAWLIAQQCVDGHLSVAPVGGWAPGEPRPGFDQQPIEAAAIADACARAAAGSSDPQWTEALHLAVRWFLGDNDAKTSMLDEETGGGADGLNPQGRSDNRGAESTLALLSTLQHGRRLTGTLRGR
jgi:hypothetical protein